MLAKQDVKACLSGECPEYVPAWLFWMDGKFIEKNRADVDQMRRQYQDDFLFVGVNHKVRSMKPKLEIGEFIDDWGCMFKALLMVLGHILHDQ